MIRGRLRRTAPAAVGVALGLIAHVHAQRPLEPLHDRPFRVVRLDPNLDRIVSPRAALDTLGSGFALTEGPVWVPEGQGGYLLFSDIPANAIYRWSPEDNGISVFMEKSGYSGNDGMVFTLGELDPEQHEIFRIGQQTRSGRVAVALTGSNGLALDAQGRLVISAMGDRAVARIEPDGTRTTLARAYDGRRFSGPNDLAIRSDGTIYFTDSVNGLRGGAESRDRELPYNGVYMIREGTVTLLDRDPQGGFPNGIAFSPDERYLFVTSGFGRILRYDVRPDGTIADGRLFAEAPGVDGLKVDVEGNVYAASGAGPGEVRIFAPDGAHLGTIELPQTAAEPRRQICATNIAFGGRDGRSLFVTACMNVYRVQLAAPAVASNDPALAVQGPG